MCTIRKSSKIFWCCFISGLSSGSRIGSTMPSRACVLKRIRLYISKIGPCLIRSDIFYCSPSLLCIAKRAWKEGKRVKIWPRWSSNIPSEQIRWNRQRCIYYHERNWQALFLCWDTHSSKKKLQFSSNRSCSNVQLASWSEGHSARVWLYQPKLNVEVAILVIQGER